MQVVPNWRFLIPFAVTLAVCAVAIHFVHRWQVGNQVGAFLRQADAARDANDSDRELAYLNRYLMARSGDLDTRERLGRLMCKSAKSGKQLLEGYLTLQTVLRQDGNRDELRRYAIEFAMRPELILFDEAQADIARLLEKRPNDGELEALAAECLVATKNYSKANEEYAKAIAHRPDLVSAYAGRASVLREHQDRPEEADMVIADMLKANPEVFRTHLIVAQYWRAFWRQDREAAVAAKPIAETQKLPIDAKVADGVAKAVAEARRLAPDDLDVLLIAADVARVHGAALRWERKKDESQKEYDEARQLLARAIKVHPKKPAAYLASAAFEWALGKPADSVTTVQKGLATISDSPELTLALLDYQIRAGDGAGASETLSKLKTAGLPSAVVEYNQARLLILKDQYLEAAAILDRVRKDLPNNPGLAREANLLLGRCYERLGENDRRLAAYRRAVPVDQADPLWVPALLGVAEAEAAQGQAAATLTSYRKLTEQAPGAWVKIARLEMYRAASKPAEQRDWRATEEAVAYAEQVFPDLPDSVILRADLLHFQGKAFEARKKLDGLRKNHSKDVTVWIALAVQDAREEDLKEAAETLAAGEREVGDSPELRLAKARLWVAAKEKDVPSKLLALADGADKFGRERHRRFLRDLAELASAIGARDAATKLWDRVTGVEPNDLGAQIVRFDREVVAGDESMMAQVQTDIRRIDGEDGSTTRFVRALMLIWKAQNRNDTSGLAEAVTLLDGLSRERPAWGRLVFAQAVALDLRGDRAAALPKYTQAVELGETNPKALLRLMELLVAGGRDQEAEEIFRKLPATTASNTDVQRLAAEVSLRTDNPKQALVQAARAVSENSTDPKEYIWQGQMYWFAGDRMKAEVPFRRAVALKPDVSDYWLVLVQYLVASGRKEDAGKEVATAGEKIAKDERSLFQAVAHVYLGESDKAVEAFRKARTERPSDLKTVRAEADFLFQSGRLTDAREAFQRVLGLQAGTDDDKEFARRMLAICLASDRDYETSRKGLEVLGMLEKGTLKPASGNETLTQRSLRAVALALQRDRPSKLEAIRLLEEVRDKLAPTDLYLLARLYTATGNKAQVRVVMTDLLRKSDKVPLYLAFFAGWLLRENDPRAAEEWVNKLAKAQPDSLMTAELSARLLAAKKDLKGAKAVLLPKAEGPKAPVGVVAKICEEIGLHDEAERLYRQYGEDNKATRSEAVLALAAFYGRRGRTADALQVCDAARSTVPVPVLAEVAVVALYTATDPSPTEVKTVAGWIEDGRKSAKPEAQAALVQLLASVRNLQGDYTGAMDLYRLAIAANAKDALAMNNLAFLLSAREGKHDDALALLAKAKSTIGPSPDLDDTEALVRLNKGEPEAARRLLETVVAQAPTGTGYFHLALAERAGKRNLEARLVWKQATEAGLRRSELHPLERAAYDEMAAQMK